MPLRKASQKTPRYLGPDGVELVYETAPCTCAPCSSSRWQASPTPILILGVIAVNWVPVTLFCLSYDDHPGRVVIAVVFHLLAALVIISWVYTCCTDPGTPPESWQRQMAAAAAQGENILVCRRSGLYKPPRSHFDSVTERLTLNMDHFCPWVVNTVGFYNRKFFMLFLAYANLTCFFLLVVLVAQAPALWPWLNSDAGERRWFPKTFNVVIYCGAIIVDAVVLCLIGPFAGYHLKMASRNETTIEGASNSQYDVGTMQNLRSVFGRELWTWAIPLYLRGPDGDGIHWPRSDARVATTSSSARGALTVSPATTTASAAVQPSSEPAP